VMSIEMAIATCTLIAVIVVAFAALQGWQGWLALKRHELEHKPRRMGEPDTGVSREVAARIELADLRERVRKLEAIASGVDL
jgi:hypothetical protein